MTTGDSDIKWIWQQGLHAADFHYLKHIQGVPQKPDFWNKVLLEFEYISNELNAKMRKILTGCKYCKYWLIKKLNYICKAHDFLHLGI